jgi:hypothetical protein
MKEELISRFKSACGKIWNISYRKSLVENQINRDVWDILDSQGMIRIFRDHLRNYGIIGYMKYFSTDGSTRFEISESEYHELRDLFLGDFKRK